MDPRQPNSEESQTSSTAAVINTGYVREEEEANLLPWYSASRRSEALDGVHRQSYGAVSQPGTYSSTSLASGQHHQPVEYRVAGNRQDGLRSHPGPLTNPPDDNLFLSILVTLCCCWLCGLFAVASSVECRSAIQAGNRAAAEEKSKEAECCIRLSAICGVLAMAIFIVLMVLNRSQIFHQI